jgi:hypothetical protein
MHTPHDDASPVQAGTLADARWSLAVRWWLAEDSLLRRTILHPEPASRLRTYTKGPRPGDGVLMSELQERLGIPRISNIGPALYAQMSLNERAFFVLASDYCFVEFDVADALFYRP